MGFIKMSKEQKNEVAIIPAGHYVRIMGCRFALLEDANVEGNQANLDRILKDQEDFNKGIGIVGEHPTDILAQGALSSMAISNTISGSGLKILPAPARIEIVDNLVSELQKLSDDIAVENPQASALAVLDLGAFLLKLLQQR